MMLIRMQVPRGKKTAKFLPLQTKSPGKRPRGRPVRPASNRAAPMSANRRPSPRSAFPSSFMDDTRSG